MMNCKICQTATTKVLSKVILKKYPADYYKCPHCGFLQTSEPMWIKEAYGNAITALDIGLMNRNLRMQQLVPRIIDACFPKAERMLDYAGGYGVFTRLMRDDGFNFYRQDPYCENIFAAHFDISDTSYTHFDLLTAFEVFEHFVDPIPEIEKLFTYSENVIFSTLLLPDNPAELENWWYLSPETGQHVAFYSAQTMSYLARRFKKHYYQREGSLHVFSREPISAERIDYALNDHNYKSSFFGLYKKPYDFRISRKSLIEQDYNYIKELLK